MTTTDHRFGTRSVDPPAVAVAEAVARALEEDLLPLGDLTSVLIDKDARRAMKIAARKPGVLAGEACAIETFNRIDPEIEVEFLLHDGIAIEPGAAVANVTGSLRSIVTAERTVLNFLGHLSGVATLTRSFVDAVESTGSDTRILDTRKTLPGLRSLQKAAVRAGGGFNHRGNLSEAVLVKDNHLGGLSIADAVSRAKRLWPGRMVEVECDRRDQVIEAAKAGATVILLDNMNVEEVRDCVALVRNSTSPGAVLLEVSGGVTLETAPLFAAAGADLISVGALTHSATVLDLGLDLLEGS